MPYKAAKISFDGSHYIATPKENFPQGHKRRRAARPLSDEEAEKKEQFEAAYKESQRVLHFFRRTERLKIVAPVSFEKVGVLVCRLHSVVFCVVILYFHDLSDHSVRRNVEDTVKMQSACFSAALPYADMFPAFAVYEVFQGVAKRLTETLFRMLFVREGESAKIAPFSL